MKEDGDEGAGDATVSPREKKGDDDDAFDRGKGCECPHDTPSSSPKKNKNTFESHPPVTHLYADHGVVSDRDAVGARLPGVSSRRVILIAVPATPTPRDDTGRWQE